ncbi:MBL fold metallo-hydrolase [Paracoccus sp. Z118]|uniref:MBL fold metallo-hydrolase n=1 Tax=Paracoccus sp. Z118 TaxID=2851017 RepID=UPI001C2BD80B|nr:MBL fold metallo-hydrolase [Paracoccus sp. Z118]MBV0892206.1 MBL fold metallo-hydrolase [Paracoccus sp. Z118]
MPPSPVVDHFFDRATGSLQYVFHDPATMKGAIVDPVWNFCPKAAATSTRSADEILRFVREKGITVEWVLDTHPHADHFTAAAYMSDRLGGVPRGIGAKVVGIQRLWKELYHDGLRTDGSQWDRLFEDGDSFMVGSIPVRVMLSPGHTLASVTYVAGDAAFVHDTLMVPQSGTSRADFPGGSAAQLWESIRAILALPAQTRLFVGHSYPDKDAGPGFMATVAEQRESNIHVRDGITREQFIATREGRDKTLSLPDRMLYALQVNLRGGRLPEPESDGNCYLKIPANRFPAPSAA